MQGPCRDILRSTASARRGPQPGCKAVDWLTNGALAGILGLPEDTGVFPRVHGAEALSSTKELEFIGADFGAHNEDDFANRKSVEDDPHAATEIAPLIETGYVRVF